MRKLICLALALVLSLGAVSIYAEEEKEEVFDGYKLSDNGTKFIVDGKVNENLKTVLVEYWDKSGEEPEPVKYNLVKIRDFAEALKDTDRKFSVSWNADERKVILTSGEAYEAKGGELTALDMENAKCEAQQNITFVVNGEEKEFAGIFINGENYVLTSRLASALEVGFTQSLKEENTNIVYTTDSDIPTIGVEDLKAKIAEKDYTIIYSWGPWCYYSKLSQPQIQKHAKSLPENAQIIGIVNRYKAYKLDDLSAIYEESGKAPWEEFAGTKEIYDYLTEIYAGEEDALNYFPRIFIVDKEAKRVGEDYNDIWDKLGEEYYKAHNMAEEDEMSDEEFDAFYPTIGDAFFKQIEK